MKHYQVVISPEADRDLKDLKQYIASKSSIRVAKRFVARITDEALSLGSFPHRGEARQGLRSELRTLGVARSVSLIF